MFSSYLGRHACFIDMIAEIYICVYVYIYYYAILFWTQFRTNVGIYIYVHRSIVAIYRVHTCEKSCMCARARGRDRMSLHFQFIQIRVEKNILHEKRKRKRANMQKETKASTMKTICLWKTNESWHYVCALVCLSAACPIIMILF